MTMTGESPSPSVLHSSRVFRGKYLLQHHWVLPMEQPEAKTGGVLSSRPLASHCHSQFPNHLKGKGRRAPLELKEAKRADLQFIGPSLSLWLPLEPSKS